MKDLNYNVISYKLTRKRDNKEIIHSNYLNIKYIENKNEFTDFPPEKGRGMFVYSNISNYWQTTLIIKVKKINEDKYIVDTENSTYIVEKLTK